MHPAVIAGWVLVSILTLSVWPDAAHGSARWVRFSTASQIPSALAIRRAEERGGEIAVRPTTPMRGLLVVPRGEGPFPAVVMVHGCRGVRPYVKEWAHAIASWGYVTLLVDSFYTRHVPPTCSKLSEWSGHESVGGRVFDAYGALEYLGSLSFVASDRIAVMGWSDGAPLSAASVLGARAFYDRHFKAAIALTPDCADFSTARFSIPLLVLAAGRDDWTPADSCRRMARGASAAAAPVSLHVYPDAHHGFDDAELVPEVFIGDAYNPNRQPARGATLAYHGASHQDAIGRVQEFLLEHLGAGNADDDSEVYALVPSIDEPAASTWVVDPNRPGPSLPPAGRSVFDQLFASADGKSYDLPFPFARLLERIEAPLRPEGSNQPMLKKALIPLGRSLQRHAAAPEYFKFPRLVVAVDTEPMAQDGEQPPIMLKDRLFIGYQERTGIIEVISYNEEAARFEFQVVKDYRTGATPRVAYAQRAICTSCHQNGAPLFSEAGWDETDTNSRIADALATERGMFYGVSMERCCSAAPAAIDNATDRANLFSAFQMLWRDGCREPETGAIDPGCRAGAFIAMLQFRLSAYSHFDTDAPSYRDGFLPLFTENWRRDWPDGLNIPNPNIPNRKPLLSPRPAHIAAELDPLRRRPPLAVWKISKPRDRRRMITGFAEFLPAADIRRLDAHLRRLSAANGAATERISRTCPATLQPLLGGAALVVVRCEDLAGEPTGPFEVLADLVYDGDDRLRGSLVRLELAGGELFMNLRLPESAIARNGQSKHARLEVLQRRYQAPPRRADGNAISAFELEWPETGGEGPLEARVSVEFTRDFAPVHAAVARMLDEDDSLLASRQPFRGTRAMGELLAALGLTPTQWCCDREKPMPPIVIGDDLDGITHGDLYPTGSSLIPAGFYDRCAACHRGDTSMPPGFMRGPPDAVQSNLSQCAERIYVRLGMWELAESAQAKSPMPPALGLPADGQAWHTGDEYREMVDYVGSLLESRLGAQPDLDAMVARGYERLGQCLPGVPSLEASRGLP
jgi:dienelactone hydrolase